MSASPLIPSLRRGGRPNRYRFGAHDRIRFRNLHYVYVGEIDIGHVLRRHLGQFEEIVSHEDMAEMARDPSFGWDRGFYAGPSVIARATSGTSSLAGLRADERDVVSRRLHYCRSFLRMEADGEAIRTDASMGAALKAIRKGIADANAAAEEDFGSRTDSGDNGPRIVGGKAPAVRTFRSWLKLYEATDGYALALRDGRCRSGNRTPQIPPEVRVLINAQCEAYATEKRPTVANCYDALGKQIEAMNAERAKAGIAPLPVPSMEAMRKAIVAMPKFSTHARRHGIDKAKKKFRLVKGATEVYRPGQRVEMDEWLIQAATIFQKLELWSLMTPEERRKVSGRWVICVAIDVATRIILAMVMAPKQSASLALAALRMILLDKSRLVPGAVTPWHMRCSPDQIVTDGGAAFVATAFTTAVADLGARHDVPPGGNPHLRGTVERFFRSIGTGLMPLMTGQTFSGVAEKGGYDPQDRASVSVEGFARAIAIWVADVYHNRPHEGLGGETPLHAWTRLVDLYGVPPAPSADDRRAIFGTTLERQVTLRGVRVFGLHYADEALGSEILHGGLSRVLVRVDEDDIGRISVQTAEGWRPMPCRTTGLDGVPAELFLTAMRDVRRRYGRASQVSRSIVLDALDRIRSIIAAEERTAGIQLQLLGPERLDAEERQILSGYDIQIDDDEPEGGDWDIIPIGPRIDPEPDAGHGERPSDDEGPDYGVWER